MNSTLISDLFSRLFHFLNNSKLFSALIMLVMNLGSKYISMDLNSYVDRILSNYVTRKIAFFAIFWMATKDILLSIFLTFICAFIFEFLLNDKSKWCIIPKKEIFMNKYRNPVSKEEYNHAKDVIEKYEKNMSQYDYFSNLYELENKKKEQVYMSNKIKMNEQRLNSKKIKFF